MRLAVFACVWCALASGAPADDPEDLLKRIRARVADGLTRLPNYTCRQTVERFVRLPNSKKYHLQDRLRLDVALIEGRELYAWPGSAKFEEKPIEQVIGTGGAISTGNFALHLQNLFFRPGAKFRHAGRQEMGGRAATRFDFEIARSDSRFILRDGEAQALVGYHGSFWADAATLDLVRLEVHADEIPAPLKFTGAVDVIEYSRVRIGESDFLLPRSAEMEILSPDHDSRNTIRLEECRQYTGESVLSFGEPAAAPAAAQPVRTVALPAGMRVEMRLETPILEGASAVGDTVSALLAQPVRKGKEVLLPKGARLSGRITRIEPRQRVAERYTVVGLTLDTGEAEGVRCQFRGALEDAGVTATGAFHVPFHINPGAPLNVWTNFRHETAPPAPNEGVFYVRGQSVRVAAGTRLVWRTGAP